MKTTKTSKKTLSRQADSPSPREVTRHIKGPVTAMLWGRAAGRCEFAGCNRPLWKSTVTQEQVNVAQQAHIYSFSSAGPRGNEGVSDDKLNSVDNLMLACHQCHRKIDQKADGGRYTAELLKSWKQAHERRVEIVTDIASDRQSHILLYGANIGEHTSPLNYNGAAEAIFPNNFYPASDQAIELGVKNSVATDHDEAFWDGESNQLLTQFGRRVKERIENGEISHLSVFGLAPQPLLTLLGVCLGDINQAAVYQRHREPQTWTWPSVALPIEFVVDQPASYDSTPALILGISATITPGRIRSVLGDNVAIWTVSVAKPHNDIIKSPEHLSQFRTVMRPLLDQIKAKHGQQTPLHIFPATPNSVAIELGRIRMPKAEMPWVTYDQLNSHGGFVRALTIQ